MFLYFLESQLNEEQLSFESYYEIRKVDVLKTTLKQGRFLFGFIFLIDIPSVFWPYLLNRRSKLVDSFFVLKRIQFVTTFMLTTLQDSKILTFKRLGELNSFSGPVLGNWIASSFPELVNGHLLAKSCFYKQSTYSLFLAASSL